MINNPLFTEDSHAYRGIRFNELNKIVYAHISVVRDLGKCRSHRDPRQLRFVRGPVWHGRRVHWVLDEV